MTLRAAAALSVYLPKLDVEQAVARLGFVQADPIRAPSPAQDLILRHRVRGYREGDLDRCYASGALEEDYLYAYGFIPRATRELLHPRKARRPLSKVERRVLATVRERSEVHPRDLEGKRVVNAWGGQSKATTFALDMLHWRGLVRVVRREAGVRVYAPSMKHARLAPGERLSRLVRLVAGVLAPVSERTLRATTARYRWLGDPKRVIGKLVSEGALEVQTADGVRYLSPPAAVTEVPDEVRLLAPFDPVVWDRRRFEHLWGWAYRFEAYTPAAKRVRGYYALPLLFRDRVIGWANIGGDDVEVGFVRTRPRDAAFRSALDEEITRLRAGQRPVARSR